MITSIVPLPEFCGDDVDICGERYGGIYHASAMTDIVDHLPILGRRITIRHRWHKYKMEFAIPSVGRTFNIVFVSDGEMDLRRPNPEQEVFMLYLREYVYPGASSPLRSNCVLWVPGINKFFGTCALPGACTLTDAFAYMLSIGCSEIHHIPSRILDNMYDNRLATLAPVTNEIGEAFMIGGSDSARHEIELAADASCVLAGYLPIQVIQMMFCSKVKEFWPLVDPMHHLSLKEIMVREASTDWGVYNDWIHKCDDTCPRYLTADSNGEITNLMYRASFFSTSDFKLQCVPPQISQKSAIVFDPTIGFGSKFDTDYYRVNGVGESVRNLADIGCNWSSDSLYTVVGSYLEDLWIYDAKGELISYIDLVWWILASGGGLLNTSCVYI